MSGTVYIYNIQAYGTHEDNGDGLGGAHIDRELLKHCQGLLQPYRR